jgi:addiction module HigA family antidote
MKTITKHILKMHNPPHPGEVLRELCLQPLGLSVTQAAQALGVSRKTLRDTTSTTGAAPSTAGK